MERHLHCSVILYISEKNDLINGFEDNLKAGRRDGYAKRVGIIEFSVGIAFLAAGLALVVFA